MPEEGVYLRVRQALPSDIDAVRNILQATFESTWTPAITEAAARAVIADDRFAIYAAKHLLEFWVAGFEGRVVGFVHWQGDFIQALHVLPSHARLGVGNSLMSIAEAEIGAAGFPSARLETDTFNLPSQGFYIARGYQEAGRYPDEEWHSDLTTILFVKTLSSSEGQVTPQP